LLWDGSSYAEKKTEVFVSFVQKVEKNSSKPVMETLQEKPNFSDLQKTKSIKSTSPMKTIDTIENETPVEKESIISEEQNTSTIEDTKKDNVQEDINSPINDLGQNKLLEDIGSIAKSETLSKPQENFSPVNNEKIADKNSIESNGFSQMDSSDFEQNGTSFIAKNQDIKGLEYKILKSPNPEYPIMAKKAQIREEIQIKVKFTVNEEGKVEDIKFYDKQEKFGFREEVIKTLGEWQFSPIKHKGKSVKMYFYKVFIFKINY